MKYYTVETNNHGNKHLHLLPAVSLEIAKRVAERFYSHIVEVEEFDDGEINL